LKQTVSSLVTTSSAGLSGVELDEILGLEGRSFLSHFRNDLGLFRERSGRGYVWFSGDGAVRKRQQRAREQMASCSTALSDAEAVLLLVELVRNPHSTLDELTELLRPRIPRLCPALIEQFLHSHQLEGKKGASNLLAH